MKKFLTYLLVAGLALLPTTAQAAVGETRICIQKLAVIDAAGMDASRSFSLDQNNWFGGYDVMVLMVDLTDANSSITQLDIDCTGSIDGNTKDYEPQECSVAAGVCTANDTQIQKATPATSTDGYRLDISGYPDWECTFSVGGGSGASADLLTVDIRLCTE
jgi:hypothetical protein